MPKGDVGYDIHKRAVKQYNKQNPSKKVNEGHCDVEGVDKYIETVAKVKEVERNNDVQRWVQKESRSSNWRQDLSEIMTDDIDSKPIKEKNVKNKIKINPKLGEAVEEMGGELIEMTEISEYEFMVEGLRQELIDEGHDPEAVNYALEEAKVTMGHDTPGNKEGTRDKLKKKAKGFLGKVAYKGYHAARDAKRAASPMLQRIKTSAKRGVRKTALKVADKLKEENVDEAMSSYDRNRKRAAQRAADRNAARAAGKTGVVPGVGYVTPRKEKETYTDEKGTVRHKSGARNEEVEAEGYEPMTPERKLRVDRAKRGAYDKDQRAQHQGDKKEADKQFKRRMAMDSKTKMKEEASMSPQEIALQKKKAMLDRMIAQKRQQGLNKVKKSEAPAKAMGEETEDSLRDRRMERGGVDGNNRYKSATKNVAMGGGKKKPYDGMSALEKVKASIRAKHGEGAIKEDAKMAKQSDEKLAALHKQVSGSDQSLPSNQFMMKRVTKEMNRRKKAT